MTRHASSRCTSWCTSILLTTAIATYSHLSAASQSPTRDVSFSSGSVLSTIDVSSGLFMSCQLGEAIPCLSSHPQWIRNTEQQSTQNPFDGQPNSATSNPTASNPTAAERPRPPFISLDPGQTTQRLTNLKRWIDQFL